MHPASYSLFLPPFLMLTWAAKFRAVVGLAAIVTLLPGSPVFSQKQAAPNGPRRSAPLPLAARERVRRAVEAVGLIFVRNASDSPTPRPRGSGVIIRGDGMLATNFHVISDSTSQRIFDELYLALGDDAA